MRRATVVWSTPSDFEARSSEPLRARESTKRRSSQFMAVHFRTMAVNRWAFSRRWRRRIHLGHENSLATHRPFADWRLLSAGLGHRRARTDPDRWRWARHRVL